MGVTLPEGVEYYKIAEVAARMRCSPMTVYRLVSRNQIPYLWFGGVIRIPAKAFQEYLDEHEQGT